MTTVKDGDFYQLVFDRTPFYPEGGGQVGDKGYLESENGDIFHILDTKKENNQIIHYCKNIPKQIDGSLNAVVEIKQRQRTSSKDSIDTKYNRFGFDFNLNDTAGIRRKAKVKEDIEFYSVMRSVRAIEYSDVCLLIVDGNRGFDGQVQNIFLSP